MIKKTITYHDYDGVKKTEDFWFNLSQVELSEMEVESGGMQQKLEAIVASQDTKQMMDVFKDIIVRSYGERSADGKRFRKVDADGYRLANYFIQSEAYTELFMDLFSDANKTVDFIIGLLPQNIQGEAKKLAKENAITGGDIVPVKAE